MPDKAEITFEARVKVTLRVDKEHAKRMRRGDILQIASGLFYRKSKKIPFWLGSEWMGNCECDTEPTSESLDTEWNAEEFPLMT